MVDKMSQLESTEWSDPRYSGEALTGRYFDGSSLEVRVEPGRGRFIVASKRIPAGTKVVDALPYVHVVEDELKTVACAYCLKPSIESMAEIPFSASIASVDAVLFNERIEAGEPFELIQQELAQRGINITALAEVDQGDVPLDVAMQVLETNASISGPHSASSTQHDASNSNSYTVWNMCCDRCQQVFYCSELCAKRDSTLHNLCCGPLKKLRHMSWPTSDLTMARTIIHILAKRHMEKPQRKESPSNGRKTESLSCSASCGGSENCTDSARKLFERFEFEFDVRSLVSNEREVKAKILARRRPLVTFLKGLGRKFPVFEVEDAALIVQLIGKIDQNTFGVRFDRNLSYAFGLFPSMSYFNHSCAPNVCVIQNNTVLNIMAIRDIEPGEEVAISYIETNRPSKDRRKCLQAEYNFYCRCLRCNAPPSNSDEDDFVQRHVCRNRQCDGKGLLIPLSDDQTACNICQSTVIIKRT